MHRYYYGLDAIRFFSACAVCVFHLGFYVWAAGYSSMETLYAHSASFDALTPIAWMGWVGVQIFFVISGFVIANSANGATPFAFLRSRLLRLWPAAWICATIALSIHLIAGEPVFGGLAGNYLRSISLWPKGDWIDGVYWSLAIEIVFYALVFGLLLSANFKRLPLLAWGLTLVSAAYLALVWAHQAGLGVNGGWFDELVEQSEFLPLRHGVYFAIGIWMWVLSNRSLTLNGWIGAAIATAFGLGEIGMRAWEIQSIEAPASAGQFILMPALVWLAALGIIIACTRRPELFTPRTEAARSHLKTLGKITYPLYLVHSTLGVGTMAWLIRTGVPPYLALAMAAATVLAVATLVAVYGEPLTRRPLQALLDAAGKGAARLKPLGLLFRRADAIPVKQA